MSPALVFAAAGLPEFRRVGDPDNRERYPL
jgi:hypothetical protein